MAETARRAATIREAGHRPEDVRRDGVQRLLREGAQLVEVLPRESYDHEHIAGAINVPLSELDAEAGRLRRDRPVITYCHDTQ